MLFDNAGKAYKIGGAWDLAGNITAPSLHICTTLKVNRTNMNSPQPQASSLLSRASLLSQGFHFVISALRLTTALSKYNFFSVRNFSSTRSYNHSSNIFSMSHIVVEQDSTLNQYLILLRISS